MCTCYLHTYDFLNLTELMHLTVVLYKLRHVPYCKLNDTLTHVMRLCVLRSTFPDWLHHKIVLSSHPLKLWSHRYVCSNSSTWRWIIHLFFFISRLFCSQFSFYTVSFFPFLLISSLQFCFPFLSWLFWCLFVISVPVVLTLSPLLLFFLLFLLSSSHVFFSGTPPLCPSLSPLSISLQLCQPWGNSQPSLCFIY